MRPRKIVHYFFNKIYYHFLPGYPVKVPVMLNKVCVHFSHIEDEGFFEISDTGLLF